MAISVFKKNKHKTTCLLFFAEQISPFEKAKKKLKKKRKERSGQKSHFKL